MRFGPTSTALLFLSFSSCSTTHARKTRVTWVNGIAHRVDHMVEGQVAISQLFGGAPIVYCHNPTAMQNDDDTLGYLSDLTQAGSQKLGRSTPEVATLAEHLKDSLAAVGPHGCVLHIAHSQGALITALAAQQYLTRDEMARMEVLAFGGATALRRTAATPFRRCINYYAINDPLLLLVPSAAQALRSGVMSSGVDGGDTTTDPSEFCFLAPRIGDPVRDHHLWGATYAQALAWEGDRYQRLYVSLWTKQRRAIQALVRNLWRCIAWIVLWVARLVQQRIVHPSVVGGTVIIQWILAIFVHFKREEAPYQPVDAALLGES